MTQTIALLGHPSPTRGLPAFSRPPSTQLGVEARYEAWIRSRGRAGRLERLRDPAVLGRERQPSAPARALRLADSADAVPAASARGQSRSSARRRRAARHHTMSPGCSGPLADASVALRGRRGGADSGAGGRLGRGLGGAARGRRALAYRPPTARASVPRRLHVGREEGESPPLELRRCPLDVEEGAAARGAGASGAGETRLAGMAPRAGRGGGAPLPGIASAGQSRLRTWSTHPERTARFLAAAGAAGARPIGGFGPWLDKGAESSASGPASSPRVEG